ncbi:sulfotransferase [Pseudoalteromonas fenneropenaei]|uniref:Sulfotransferase n=1 Tax=Pseudoalteromonas fenneropenaei TaxID=1737459 RepID=A0ABV7CLX3_9GAMM
MLNYHHVEQLLIKNQLLEAHQQLVAHLKNAPQDHRAFLLLSKLHVKNRDLNKALAIIEHCITLSSMALYCLEKAKLLYFLNQPQAAKDALARATERHFDALDHDCAANLYLRLNQYQAAHQQFAKAYRLAPTQPEILLNYAISEKMCGNLDLATQLLNDCVSLNPNHYRAQLAYSEISPKTIAEDRIAQLNAILAQQQKVRNTAPVAQQYLHHALALEYEKQGEFQSAWTHFSLSKAAVSQHSRFEKDAFQEYIASVKAQLNTPLNYEPYHDIEPIFIIGMPRSGTSLTEQILAQLVAVEGLGELTALAQYLQISPDFAHNTQQLQNAYQSSSVVERYHQFYQQLSKQQRGIDKQPFNILFADLLIKAFPNAKLLILNRNRFDTCIGNMRQLFQSSSPFHQYSFSFSDICAYYDGIDDLAQHLATHYPNQVSRVSYEMLVTEPQHTMTEICAFLGLQWHSNALNFHQTQYFSATASKQQLRQPLNSRSLGKFRGIYPLDC